MMARKRRCAGGSSAAGPRSVSMKPIRLASGVRSSWLALATKSARIRSTARSRVRSDSTTIARPPSASGAVQRDHGGLHLARHRHRKLSSAVCVVPVRERAVDRGAQHRDGAAPPACRRRTRRAPPHWRAARRGRPPSTISGSGSRSTIASSARRIRPPARHGPPASATRRSISARRFARPAAERAGAERRDRALRPRPAHDARKPCKIARPDGKRATRAARTTGAAAASAAATATDAARTVRSHQSAREGA